MRSWYRDPTADTAIARVDRELRQKAEREKRRREQELRAWERRGAETRRPDLPAAAERPEHKRVGGNRPAHDQDDCDGEARQRPPCGEDGRRHCLPPSSPPALPRFMRSTTSAIAPSPVRLHAVPMPSSAMYVAITSA